MPESLSDRLLKYEPLCEWNPNLAKQKLNELYANVLFITDNTIVWYQENKSKKGKSARDIRITAIVLFIVATLVPFISAILNNNIYVLYTGYLMASLAGGLLAFDRFYGLSNSWIRFALAGMQLESLRNSFVQTWQLLYFSNVPFTKQRFTNMVNALLKYQESFNNTVKSETEQWAIEFQQNLKDLIATIQSQSDKFNSDISAIKNKQTVQETSEEIIGNIPMQVIKEAIARKFDDWKLTFGINAVGAGKKIHEKTGEITDINCLVFSPSEKLKEGERYFVEIPSSITFISADGHTYQIPTDVRADGGEIFASSPALLCDGTVPKRPGCSISREVTQRSSGTLGLKVYKDGNTYLLGCYHVLCEPELNDGQYEFKAINSIGSTLIVSPSVEDQTVIQGATRELGRVVEGYFSDQIDCSIALIENSSAISENLCVIDLPPQIPLTITDDHANARYKVISVGRTTGKIQGSIQEALVNCEINYRINNQWQKVKFVGLIRTNQQTEGGDSGAPVVDKENNVIGIVIANSNTFTYVLPIQRILAKLSITLKEIL